MAEIIELIAADHLHIMRWQVRLAGLRRHRGEPGCGPELAATWDTLAALIGLHMAADEAVCGPAIYGTRHSPGSWQSSRAATRTTADPGYPSAGGKLGPVINRAAACVGVLISCGFQ